VKLLFDENLSWHLVDLLADCYPGSSHVRSVGLERADDSTVWDYAAATGLTIVSEDSGFHQRSLLFGAPPKVVWIHIGNCSTSTSSKFSGDTSRISRNSSRILHQCS
jgi:predicted nuclease of predicted toxin-antitoxin system